MREQSEVRKRLAEISAEVRVIQEGREAEERWALEEEERAQVSRPRYLLRLSVHLLKLSAGLSRLFFEDLLNLLVQFGFSVKYWELMSFPARVFTGSSMATGLTLAFVGPLKDGLRCRHVRHLANKYGVDLERPLQDNEGEEPAMQVALTCTQPLNRAVGAGLRLDDDAPDEEAPREAPHDGLGPEVQPLIVLYRGTLLQFLDDNDADHSVVAHRLLVLSSVMYWGSNAAIPLLFGSQIKGGTEAGIPQLAVLYFTMITVGSLFVEFWVASRTEEGLYLLWNFTDVVWKAFCGFQFKELVTIVAMGQSLLGRYDTFCDMIFVCVLWHTEKITELRFDSQGNFTLPLPFPLQYVAVFSVVVGIFGFQGVPGILCLIMRKGLPAALQLNEFNFLLGMVEYQLK